MTQKHHFFGPEDIPVFDLDQIYMVSSMWHDTDMRDVWGTFDLVVRDMPKHRNFMVFTGLEEMLLGVENWSYSAENVRLLRREKLISASFAKYLRNFKFSGDIHAMKEGTLFFPGEPVLRISAPMIEANLLTAFFLTSLSSNTIFSTKYIRSIIAAGQDRKVIGPGPQRAQGFETSFKAQRAALIVGGEQSPSPVVRDRLNIAMGHDHTTIAYHAFIKSYDSERQAMEVAANLAGVDLTLMVDTYDLKEGLKNAIRVADSCKKRGLMVKIAVDSGNLLKLSKYVRQELDQNGHKDVKIVLASNLDEYKISRLVEKGSPAELFIVATEGVTSSDDPKLEAVYKIAEVEKNGLREYRMKLAKGKESLPGRKQVYRAFRNGKMVRDVIGLEREHGLGTGLLKPMIQAGKLTYKLPSVQTMRKYVETQLKTLPKKYLDIHREHPYEVRRSKKLEDLIDVVRAKELEQYK